MISRLKNIKINTFLDIYLNIYLKNIVQYLLCSLMFIIPVAWWTRLNANYYSTKLTLFFLAGALAWLVIPNQISIPKFPRAILLSLLVIITFQVGYHVYAFQLYDFLYIFKFLSFCALILWLYSLNLDLENVFKKTSYIIFLTVITILAISLYEFYETRINNLSTDISTLLSTFGNVNMFAEFFLLTLPFLFHWTRYRDKIPQWFKLIIFSCWIFFILYCRSRSAWLGLGLWLVLVLRYKIVKKELFFVVLSFVLYFACMYAPANQNNIVAVKDNNTAARLALYESTLQMIKDHPWGIRVGRFMGEIEPYQMESSFKPSEYNYFDQPHSEFLKWGAQFGWVFLAAAGVFFFAVIFQLGKWVFTGKNFFLVGSFAVLLPEILFQFPFENPASLIYLSLVFALFFQQFVSNKKFHVHFSFRPIAYILFLAGLYSAFGFVNSVYQESTIPRNENIVAACEYYPINVKACHAKLTYYLDSKKYDSFVSDFKVDFMKEPFFVDYLRLLPTYYSIKQNNKKTCESLFLYKTIFPEQKAFENKYYDNCKGFTNLFYFENPKQFKAKYLIWLDNLN